jgi:hypothetical protein
MHRHKRGRSPSDEVPLKATWELLRAWSHVHRHVITTIGERVTRTGGGISSVGKHVAPVRDSLDGEWLRR